MNLDVEKSKAEVLIEALPYIQKFNRKIWRKCHGRRRT